MSYNVTLGYYLLNVVSVYQSVCVHPGLLFHSVSWLCGLVVGPFSAHIVVRPLNAHIVVGPFDAYLSGWTF